MVVNFLFDLSCTNFAEAIENADREKNKPYSSRLLFLFALTWMLAFFFTNYAFKLRFTEAKNSKLRPTNLKTRRVNNFDVKARFFTNEKRR
jgi:hypothetical protein